jgi:pilus assembly protein CpaF
MGLKNRIATAVTDEQEVGRNGDVQFYRKRLLEEIDLSEMASLSLTQRRARLERVVGHLVSREGPVLSNRDRAALIRRVVDEALGLGVLEPLLADEDVTEIMVNGAGDVFIERAGRIERVDTRFTSEDQLYQTIDRIVSAVNRRVDESSPMVDARLPGGERVNVIIPPLSLSGPVVTIRRFPRPYRLEELVAKGSLDPVMAAFLAGCIRARLNVLISGGTGSGKTTMLNSLSAFVPPGERIITIEDSAELSLQQQHVIRLESRPANVEGHGEITIRDLVRNSLRMRPDRIIVGEVRGGETMDMLQAMNTGHEGSLCTVHANSSDDAILRLETLASMSELNIPSDSLRDQINGAIDVIIHLARTADGARRMVEICTLASRRRETFRLATIVNFEQEPLGPDRVVRGRFRYYPVPRPLAERLVIAGEQVPPQLGVATGPSFTPEREAV